MTTTIQPILTELPTSYQGFKAWQVQWADIPSGALCAPVDLVEFSDRSVQIEGTFGTSSMATVAIAGSNDLSNFETLRDPSSTSLTGLSATGIHGILEMTGLIKPVITGGDSGTLLTITLFLRRTWR